MALKKFCDRKGCEREIPNGESWFAITISRQGDNTDDFYRNERSDRYSTGFGNHSQWHNISRDDRMICSKCATEISKVALQVPDEPKPVVSQGPGFRGALDKALGVYRDGTTEHGVDAVPSECAE